VRTYDFLDKELGKHRMFCHITQNWSGRPLISRQAVVELIGQTTTQDGLKIRSSLDESLYPRGIKISDQEMARISLCPAPFHGEWSCSIMSEKLGLYQVTFARRLSRHFD